MALNLDFILVADGLSVFMAIASSFIGALIVIYSLGYIGHEENQNEYYLIVLLFIGAMMGLVFSANLIFMYLFWEIAAIACWRLIGFYRGKEHVLKADKAFLVTFFGAVFMLLGFIMIYNQTGTFDITAMRGTLIPGTAVLLILLGMFSKSATVPLHTWLPGRRRGADHRSPPCCTRRCWSRSASTPTRASSATPSSCPRAGSRPSRSSSSSPAWSPPRRPRWKTT